MSAFERLGITPAPCGEGGEKQYSHAQAQTKQAFAFKWAKRHTYESPALAAIQRQWLLERYCDGDPAMLAGWLSGRRKIILDAGCGACYSALLLFADHLKEHDYLGVDISEAVEIGRQRFAEKGYPGDFLQANLLELPIPDESVDMIFCEGVLHHTDSTEQSLGYLATKLKRAGRFLFYVYARKAVIREFTDDFIRDKLREMSDEQAWDALMPLSRLGSALGRLNAEIDVPQDIPFLGIKKGKIDIQRFFYWNICKAYYRPELDIEELNHINFDWFRPLNCHRHTTEEVVSFCRSAGLEIERLNEQPSGITVVAVKA